MFILISIAPVIVSFWILIKESAISWRGTIESGALACVSIT